MNFYIIAKEGGKDEYFAVVSSLIKKIKSFTTFNLFYKHSKNISLVQKSDDVKKIQNSYTQELIKYTKNGYNIAFSPDGVEMNSIEFANLCKDRGNINFFVGGAYGFDDEFLSKCDKVVALGKFIMSHKLAMLVSIEQIYRSICINSNHPYHK